VLILLRPIRALAVVAASPAIVSEVIIIHRVIGAKFSVLIEYEEILAQLGRHGNNLLQVLRGDRLTLLLRVEDGLQHRGETHQLV
jgi:hypothetical protein